MRQGFYAHNKENERETKLITRSSAIFHFICNKNINTEIHYLNYWLIKRGVSDIVRHITLRNMDGKKLFKTFDDVVTSGGQKINIQTILDKNDITIDKGSIEVEFFSETNLFVAYPALVVRYVGANWHTFAHSSQRILATESGDDDIKSTGAWTEGNLTIQAGKNVRAFVIVHNGGTELVSAPLTFCISSKHGEQINAQTPNFSWKPYQTRFIYIDQFVDYKELLNGDIGTFNVKFKSCGIFSRLIAGCEKEGAWSIDHTNFADTEGEAALDVVPISNEAPESSLVFNIPNNVQNNWMCYADVYPTFPKDETYDIKVTGLSKNGKKSFIDVMRASHAPSESFNRIEINNKTLASGRNIEISFTNSVEIPRRFHMGIHYQVGNGLAGFLTDGPLPYTTSGIRTRWFPVFELLNCKNYLMMAHRTLAGDTVCDVEFELSLFNSFDDPPKIAKVTLQKYSQICLQIDEIFPMVKDYLKDEAGWIYMTSPLKQRSVVHYAAQFGENSIGVCHAF